MKKKRPAKIKFPFAFAFFVFAISSLVWANDADLFQWLTDRNVAYRYEPATKSVFIDDERIPYSFVADSPFALENGVVVPLDRAPTIVEGAFLLSPATFLELASALADYTPRTIPSTVAVNSNSTNDEGRITLIVIDAGHGGRDPGAIGVNEQKEKDAALVLAKELKSKLAGVLPPYVDVVLTRETDVYLTLQKRAEIANAHAGVDKANRKNGLFLSLHMNASFNKTAKGFEVYFLTADESSAEARSVAQFENNVRVAFDGAATNERLDTGLLIERMLIEQFQRESKMLAEGLVNHVRETKVVALRKRPVQSALFYVLKGALMPGALIEAGFVTNPDDAANILDADYRASLVEGIAKGVNEFILTFEHTEGFTK